MAAKYKIHVYIFTEANYYYNKIIQKIYMLELFTQCMDITCL